MVMTENVSILGLSQLWCRGEGPGNEIKTPNSQELAVFQSEISSFHTDREQNSD